jgi:hypothetical protein
MERLTFEQCPLLAARKTGGATSGFLESLETARFQAEHSSVHSFGYRPSVSTDCDRPPEEWSGRLLQHNSKPLCSSEY